MRDYSQGPSEAKYNRDPLSLKEWRSEKLLEDAKHNLPILSEIVEGSTKGTANYIQHKKALMLSSFLNTWIPRSNFLYRTNVLLIAGSCKTEVRDLFHRLGLSCHPSTIRRQLQAAADYFNKDTMKWKKENEINLKSVKLLEEVLKHQVPSRVDDFMEIYSIDFSLETVCEYNYYDDNTYEKCSSILPPANLMDDDIVKAISNLKNTKLPRYR